MNEWVQALSALEAAFDRMLKLADDKRQAIVSNDVSALETIVREETGLLKQIALLEEKRQRAVVVYALRSGLDPKGITLQGLIDPLPEGQAKDSLTCQFARFREKLGEMERLNSLNNELIATQRDIVHFMLEGTARPTQLGVQYSGTGRDADVADHISLVDKDA